MDRRTFLKFMLGAAALPTATKLAMEREVEQLGNATDVPDRENGVARDIGKTWKPMYWREPVCTKANLPKDDPDCVARFVGAEDTVYLHAKGYGWFPGFSLKDLRAGDGLTGSLV
jgi:hypothetical protein